MMIKIFLVLPRPWLFMTPASLQRNSLWDFWFVGKSVLMNQGADQSEEGWPGHIGHMSQQLSIPIVILLISEKHKWIKQVVGCRIMFIIYLNIIMLSFLKVQCLYVTSKQFIHSKTPSSQIYFLSKYIYVFLSK